MSCSSSQRLILWVPPQAERGGCMQGNRLEKESCAQLPHLVLFQAYSSEPQTKENRWISEARMQDHQDSGVAVSHQKYDIFNSDRFPHACCGTVMLPWRRQRPQRSICSPSSEARKQRPGRGLGEVAVHMIPSPIHFLAYTRPFRPGVEPRGSAGGWNYNSRFAYVFRSKRRRRY